ncbi:hypothetical protein ES332_A07G111000v1 [Gossypium tomentosum]|uniref:Uncharacterized protein n=1 Tax=Gossypium tomentosum TaxID=34277 RepID=A0A5D2PRR6_GOSTO|nr:hypothetical protein ES332_A07G111000v1 [Gossypium tomentosum]
MVAGVPKVALFQRKQKRYGGARWYVRRWYERAGVDVAGGGAVQALG